MVGFFAALILLGFAVATGQSQVASASPSSSATPTVIATPSTSSGRFELLRKAFDQLSPEQQERILQNLRRWQDLSVHEIQEKRQAGNAAIIDSLKKEFSTSKASATTATH